MIIAEKKNIVLYFILFFLILISVYIFHLNYQLFFLILTLPIIIFYFPKILFDSEKLIYAILFFLIVFPQTYWYTDYVFVNLYSSFLILVILLIHSLRGIRIDNSFFLTFLLFIIIIIINAIRGIYSNYDKIFIFYETIKFLFYPIAFYFFLTVFKEKKDLRIIKKIFEYCIIFTSIASTEIIMIYLFITKGGRVLTRFGNVILIGLIISLSFIRIQNISPLKKVFYYFSIILMSIGILLTMQRSLWIATAISITASYLLDLISRKENFKESLLKLSILGLLLLSVFFVFNKISLDTDVLLERTEKMQQGEMDSSLAIRIYTFIKVLDITKNDAIWGRGLGDAAHFPLLTSKIKNLVDNSYIALFWKMGIIGLVLFLYLFIKVLWKLYYVIKTTKDILIQSISIVVFSVIVGQLVNSLACVVLTQYHYNFIWAMFIAITELFYKWTDRKEEISW